MDAVIEQIEEQRLGPHEEIDMPVFFFIDPEICDDPSMESCNAITLSYTFFKTDEDDDFRNPKGQSNRCLADADLVVGQ